MKKALLFASTTLFFFGNLTAQNAIPNPGFESWTSQGSYDDCAGWGTIDQPVSSACFCKGTAVKTAVAGEFHGGLLAMKLKTLSVFGQTAPGIAATGIINQTTQAVDGGVAYNLRPDSIVGWYRYTPSGTDTGSVEITLSRWSGTARNVVAHAKFIQNASVASYVRFSQPLTYSLTGTPDTMVIILLSSSTTAAQVNSTMFVDDLGLIFNSTAGISPYNNSNSLISVYPNPGNGNVTVSSNTGKNINELKVTDMLGQTVYEVKPNTEITSLQLGNAGVYFITVTSGKETNTKKVIVN